MASNLTPNLGLPKSIPTQTNFKQRSGDIDVAYDNIDKHTHTEGNNQIPWNNGLDKSIDLDMVMKAILNAGLIEFINASGVTTGNCLYVEDDEVHFRDINGKVTQITKDGVVNVTGTGNILNITGSASLAYNDIVKTFTFTDSTGTAKAQIVVKSISFDNGTGTTALTSSSTGTRTVSIPDANGVIVLANATQTLTFKTLTDPKIVNTPNVVTTVIDFNKAINTISASANTTFTLLNRGVGKKTYLIVTGTQSGTTPIELTIPDIPTNPRISKGERAIIDLTDIDGSSIIDSQFKTNYSDTKTVYTAETTSTATFTIASDTEMDVSDASSFPMSGAFLVTNILFIYTGTTSTSFTGVSISPTQARPSRLVNSSGRTSPKTTISSGSDIHSVFSLVCPPAVYKMTFLGVGGGGGAGLGQASLAFGAGGAGGLVTQYTFLSLPGSVYYLYPGAGGTGRVSTLGAGGNGILSFIVGSLDGKLSALLAHGGNHGLSVAGMATDPTLSDPGGEGIPLITVQTGSGGGCYTQSTIGTDNVGNGNNGEYLLHQKGIPGNGSGNGSAFSGGGTRGAGGGGASIGNGGDAHAADDYLGGGGGGGYEDGSDGTNTAGGDGGTGAISISFELPITSTNNGLV